ncbi:MAG TPA: hypothetical protein VK039_13270 [Brevibacterium sp.]|nr:hypothetical protein [Brevibacterium sp.]
MPWRPEIEYGHTILRLSLPCRPWIATSRGIGGSEMSAAGVPAAYQVRRDQLMRLTLRYYEWEWGQLDRWIEYAQLGGVSVLRTDQGRPEVAYPVYLDAPAMGETAEPRRSPEFPAAMEIDVEVRHVPI